MKRVIVGVILIGAWLFTGCNDDSVTQAPCPSGSAAGPALSDSIASLLLLTNNLGESWNALDLGADSLQTEPATGLTGATPNDVEVVGHHLYIVNSGDNTISDVDLNTGKTIGCISIGASTNPWELEIDPSDSTKAWLTTYVSGEIMEIDLASRHVLRRHTIEPTLEGLWVSNTTIAVTKTAFNSSTFTYGTGYVILIRKSDLTEIHRFPVPTNPQFVFEGGDHRVHVVCTGDYGLNPGRVVRLESTFLAVRDTLVLGGAPGRAILAPNGTAYLTAFCDGLMSYDTVAFTAIHDQTNALLPGTCAGDVDLDGTRIFVADFSHDAISVLDRGSESLIGSVPVGDGPNALVIWFR